MQRYVDANVNDTGVKSTGVEERMGRVEYRANFEYRPEITLNAWDSGEKIRSYSETV